MDEDHLTIKRELQRKSLEALDRLVGLGDRGAIGRKTLFVATDALYDAVVGLVDREVSDVIYAVRQEAKGAG
jgi:hypothetical protein